MKLKLPKKNNFQNLLGKKCHFKREKNVFGSILVDKLIFFTYLIQQVSTPAEKLYCIVPIPLILEFPTYD